MLSEMKPEDAFLIFEKWHTEGTRVLCAGSFFGCSLTIVGMISEASVDRVVLTVLNSGGTFTLDLLWDDLAFGYMEPKDSSVEVPEYAKSSAAVTVGLPLRISPAELEADVIPKREKLIFFEMREPEGN